MHIMRDENESNIGTKEIIAALILGLLLGCLFMTAASHYDKDKAAHGFIESCEAGTDIEYKGKSFRCAVISPEIGLEAARYRAVKNCTRITNSWVDNG